MEVLSLPGGGLSSLPVYGAVAVLLMLGLVAMTAAPRLAFAAWLAGLCAVPVWVGVSAGVGLEAHVVASVGLVTSLLPALARGRRLAPARLTVADGLMVLLLLAALVAVASGRVTFSATFVLTVQWTAAYLAGRLVGYRIPLSWVYAAVAVAFTGVAVLALVESLSGWNPFLDIPGDSGLRAVWAVVQDRGGEMRAEGAFGHSIALGASLALAVPITLAAPFRTAVRLGMVVLLLAATVVTYSRIALLTGVLGAALAVLVLRSDLPGRLRVAATTGMLVLGVASASVVSQVFAAAGDEASDSANYRLQLLDLVPGLQPFGWASSAYQLATGQTVLANVQTADGTLHSIDNALLLVGLSYGWVPMAVVLLLLLAAAAGVLSGRATAPTVAVVAQVPAFATVALITQYSTFTWFVAGLAVFAQSVAARPVEPAGEPVTGRGAGSPEMVDAFPGSGSRDLS